MPSSPRLIIAANRLPIVIDPSDPEGEPAAAPGGLATGLRHLHESTDCIWIGSTGDSGGAEASARVTGQLARRRMVGIELTRDLSRRYYDGFCNEVLWPLLHGLTERIRFTSSEWDAYRVVNERFALALAAEYRPGDTIWVHDYHLMLVPRLVREILPQASIGFFLHVPFPSPDVFRICPWRDEVLDGLLGANVVGFHASAYAAHFEQALRSRDARSDHSGRRSKVHIGVYPMGIDVESFSAPLEEQARTGAPRGADRCRILLGVDRLDYTKGISPRLQAYSRLLRARPDLRGRVQLIQIAVPSRTRVRAYMRLRNEVERLVGRINGEHGDADWTPVHYVRRSLSKQQLIALYRRADVMLVTPVRDGMNLVAKEFAASRTDRDGVLVLSEFAGAAESLADALMVNPHSVDEMTAAIAAALEMPASERRRRMSRLRATIAAHDVHWWTARFLTDVLTHAPGATRAAPRAAFLSSLALIPSTFARLARPRRRGPAQSLPSAAAAATAETA